MALCLAVASFCPIPATAAPAAPTFGPFRDSPPADAAGEPPAEASPETPDPAPFMAPDDPLFQQHLRDRLDGLTGGDVTPEVSREIDALPAPVRETRAALIAAAEGGDIEALRPVIEAQAQPPAFGAAPEEDPVAFMRTMAGDRDGRETLAILIEILDAGYAHLDPGTETELYLWPYVAAIPFAEMTPAQEVDLYKIITPFDRESMEAYGRYTYYRLGIAPDGAWRFFLAGE